MQTASYAEIQQLLIDYSGWELIEEEGRAELYRVYQFKSFEAALGFMCEAGAQVIGPQNHHPRWENVYNRLSIWLTTHDAGNQISQKDLDVAAGLEMFYRGQMAG